VKGVSGFAQGWGAAHRKGGGGGLDS